MTPLLAAALLSLLHAAGCAHAPSSAERPKAAAPQPVESSPAAPTTPSAVWTPELPRHTEGAVPWSRLEVASACPEAPSGVAGGAPVVVIASASAFEARYCRAAKLDWARYRLLALRVDRDVHSVDVVADSERLNVMLKTRLTCDAGWGSDVTLLVEDTSRAVAVHPSEAPAEHCPDGYAY